MNSTLAQARHCIKVQQEQGSYRGAKICQLAQSHPNNIYAAGDFVLVEFYDDPDYCTIEMPMTAEQIAEQRANHSRLTTWVPVVGFPTSFLVQTKSIKIYV